MHVPGSTALLRRVHRWGEESQQQSRRNAMVALTALTQRRAERIEVEEFLAALRRPAAPEVAVSAANL